MPAHHELRRSRRVPSFIEVKWHRRDGGVECIGTDINADGMFLKTGETIEPGTLMELRLKLPDRELAVFATAVFVGRTRAGAGIGVEFYMMSSHTRLSWLAHYHTLLDGDSERVREPTTPPTYAPRAE